MSSIRVRLAAEADNEAILALASQCPQEGMITYFPNRTPRFNTIHRLIDSGAWHFVACKGDEIIGLVGVIHFQAMVLGRPCKIGYMLDLRVHKEYRSGLAAFRLVRAAVDHVEQSDADMVIVNFLKDNKRPMVFAQGRGGLPPAHYLGTNRIYSILPLWRLKTDKRFSIGRATGDDIPEISDLLSRYAKKFLFSPLITEQQLTGYMDSIAGLSPENFFIAREGGKIKAVTALWDDHTYKSYQVLRLTPAIRLVSGLLRLLSGFMKVPRPIRLNEPLKQLSLALYAHDDCPSALDALFRHCSNISLGADYTMIMFYAPENDPMFSYVRRYPGVSVRSEMYLFAKDTSFFDGLPKGHTPLMMDLSMLI